MQKLTCHSIDNNLNTLQKGIAGQYNFNIKAILKEAWKKTHGIKGTFWLAVGIALLISIGILIIFLVLGFLVVAIADVLHASKPTLNLVLKIAVPIFIFLSIFATAPLSAGVIMIGVKHCAGEKVRARSVLDYYVFWRRLWVVDFVLEVINFLSSLPLFIWFSISLIIAYFYVLVSYFMFMPLVAEKKLKVWPALEASRKAISYHWFKMLWFLILLLLIIFASLLTLGIALIWTLPMLNNAIGILYREMFGVDILLHHR